MSTLSNTIISETLSNGNTINYRIVQETAYHAETPDRVILLLEQSRQNKTRYKITYGDLATGRIWDDQPFACHVGRSCGGRIKIPLAIRNARSMGGESLLDHCIVKIEPANKKNGTRPLWDVTKAGYKAS